MTRKIIRVFIVLLLIPVFMFFADLYLAGINKPPLFALKVAMYKDGGTKEYQGIGYRIIDYNEMIVDGKGRQDVVFISKFINVGKPNN